MFKSLSIQIITIILLSASFHPANAQLFGKKQSKKDLIKDKESLMITIDSLKQVIEGGAIELSDTTNIDTINTGVFNYDGTPHFEGAEPGENPDSLLNLWYKFRDRELGNITSTMYDSLVLTSNIPDSIYIERIKKMNSFIPIPYNNIVRNKIILYTERIPNTAKRIMGLSPYYMPIFEEIFDYYGLPQELKAVAIIESALNPVAVSRAKAKGIWQFMYRTAQQYNLQITSYVDERLDPVASAHAAAKYLRDAYTIYGDWALAISSYNCGAGNVNKAIRRAGSKEFWDIYPYLPRETRGYVPAFVGALYLMNYYTDYQIVPESPYNLPPHIDTFKIKKNLHFEQISENIGISVDQLRILNPQYTKDIIPGNEREYILRLPYNFTVPFVEKENIIYTYKDSIYFNPIVYNKLKESRLASSTSSFTHTVRRGETLGGIALKYKVKVSDLQRWNNLRSNSILRIGQKLRINKGNNYVSSSAPATTSSGGYQWYTIRKGDTLLGIAHKYPGVSLSDILRINGLTKNSKIYPGKKIKIKSL